jgi:hypothetical protein
VANPLPLLEQIKPYAPDEATFGRTSANLRDIVEECEWLLQVVSASEQKTLSEDELEALLIDIDVRFIMHVGWHLRSLRKDFPSILANFPDEDV